MAESGERRKKMACRLGERIADDEMPGQAIILTCTRMAPSEAWTRRSQRDDVSECSCDVSYYLSQETNAVVVQSQGRAVSSASRY